MNGHTRACIQRILNCGPVRRCRSGIVGSEHVRRAGIERAVRICQRNVHICRIQQPKTSLSANGRCNNRPKRLKIVLTGGFHKTTIPALDSAPSKDFTVKSGVLIRPKDHLPPIPISRRIRPNDRIGGHDYGLSIGDLWILSQIIPSHQHRPAPGFPGSVHLRLNQSHSFTSDLHLPSLTRYGSCLNFTARIDGIFCRHPNFPPLFRPSRSHNRPRIGGDIFSRGQYPATHGLPLDVLLDRRHHSCVKDIALSTCQRHRPICVRNHPRSPNHSRVFNGQGKIVSGGLQLGIGRLDDARIHHIRYPIISFLNARIICHIDQTNFVIIGTNRVQAHLRSTYHPNRPIGCHNLAFVRNLPGHQKDISLLRFNAALIDNRST